jgi:uncharacterized repeat protein (TIGR01451 family)
MRSLAVAVVAAGALALPAATAATSGGVSADLLVTIAARPDPVRVGHIVSFSIAVHNRGPQRATRVVLTIGLPIGPVSFSALPSRPACGPPGPGPGPIRCRRVALPAGSSWVLRVGVHADRVRKLRVSASAHAATYDPRPRNSRAAASVSVLPMP